MIILTIIAIWAIIVVVGAFLMVFAAIGSGIQKDKKIGGGKYGSKE